MVEQAKAFLGLLVDMGHDALPIHGEHGMGGRVHHILQNIHTSRSLSGDMLAAVGVYKGPGIKPVYKHLRRGEAVGLSLDVTFQGVPISIHIGDKEIAIEVREKVYSINYFVCIGQMVVLDHRTKRVKFWEEKGYSARKEGIGSLLRGGSFIAKGPGQEICVVGYHFRDFFEGELFETHLHQVLNGEVPSFSDVAYEINGFALLASILPIESSGQIEGIIVKFRNIEDIRTTIMERNTAIAAAERKYRESSERSLPDSVPNPLLPFGNSAPTRAVRRRTYKISQMDCNILIVGESGTGKTRLARWILQAQPRGGQMVQADCSAIDPAGLEEKLFGRAGGAPGLFRSAAALNMEAVLLTPGCSDPLYRRSSRVSMGTVFQVPWTFIKDDNEMRCERENLWPEQAIFELRKSGYKTAALALTDDSVSIDDPALMQEEKLAVILGTEGEGLMDQTIDLCDYTVKIPMSHGVDSLNVAAASAVAFWQLGRKLNKKE